MALYVYTGEPGRIWPDLPVTPASGDVVDWGETVPDPNAWDPSRRKATRGADNETEQTPDVPADVPADPAPTETQE